MMGLQSVRKIAQKHMLRAWFQNKNISYIGAEGIKNQMRNKLFTRIVAVFKCESAYIKKVM